MIAKKNPKLNFERRRVMLLQAGLLTASSFTLAAFTYKSPLDTHRPLERTAYEEIAYEIVQPETPKEKILDMKDLKVEQEQTTVDLNPELTEDSKETENTSKDVESTVETGTLNDPNIVIGEFTIGTKDIEEEIFEFVPVEARYIGGFEAMKKYIRDNIRIPNDGFTEMESGTVYLSFVVEKDGEVSNVVVEKGINPALDREAKRVVRSFPNWIPGEYEFRQVRTKVRLPIVIELE